MELFKNIFKISYLNKPFFEELTNDEKRRFEDKFNLIHERLPFSRNFVLNDIINEGLVNLVKDNREAFINDFYVDFVDQLVIKMGNQRVRYRKSSYKYGYHLTSQNDFYSTFILFINYFEYYINGEILQDPMLFDKKINKDFCDFYNIYRDIYLSNSKKEGIYKDTIKYLFIYFLSHNELVNNKDLYIEMINSFIEDKALVDYYYMNFQGKTNKDIPEHLFNKYNERNKIIIR